MGADERRPTNSRPRGSSGAADFVRQLADVLDLPFVLVGSVIAGAGAGYLLDRWLGTSPVFALLLGAAGFAGGFLEVLRRVKGKQNRHGP